MGITLRLAAGKRGQQAAGMKMKGRCQKHLEKQLGDSLPPHTHGGERTHSDVGDVVHLGNSTFDS